MYDTLTNVFHYLSVSSHRDSSSADPARVPVLPGRQALRAGRPGLDPRGQGQTKSQSAQNGSTHHASEYPDPYPFFAQSAPIKLPLPQAAQLSLFFKFIY